MKAKIKTLIILLAIFATSLIAAIVAGCNIGEENAKDSANAMGMTASVTYYTNGGYFQLGKTPDGKVYRTDYYRPGSPILNIGFDKIEGLQSLTILREGYDFLGWEEAELNEDGLPILYELNNNGERTGKVLDVLTNGTADIKGSDGRQINEGSKRFEAVPSGKRVFDNGHPRIGEEDPKEHRYLVATWEQHVVVNLEYKLITDEDITVEEDGEEVTYKNGDVFHTYAFKPGESEIELMPNSSPKTLTGFSYIHLYEDAEGTKPIRAGTQVYRDDNPVVYAKYLKGSWTSVRTAANVVNMLNSMGGNFFLVFDIDCAGRAFSYKNTTFNGTIDGNGKKLSNIAMSYTFQQVTGSLFGRLGESATIKDLTIENVEIVLSINGSSTTYALFTSVAEGATLENFKVKGLTLDISMSGTGSLTNIQQVGGVYQTGRWIYGDAYSTDAEFEEHFGKIVEDATLIIDTVKIVPGGQL